MNNNIINVNTDIVIVKELDRTILFVLNLSFSTKTLFLVILPCKSILTLTILLFIFIPQEWLNLANILALILFNP